MNFGPSGPDNESIHPLTPRIGSAKSPSNEAQDAPSLADIQLPQQEIAKDLRLAADRIIRVTPSLLRRIVTTISDLNAEGDEIGLAEAWRCSPEDSSLASEAVRAINALITTSRNILELFREHPHLLHSQLHDLPQHDTILFCQQTLRPLLQELHQVLRSTCLVLPTLIDSYSLKYTQEMALTNNSPVPHDSAIFQETLWGLRRSLAMIAGIPDSLDSQTSLRDVIEHTIATSRLGPAITRNYNDTAHITVDMPTVEVLACIQPLIDHCIDGAKNQRVRIQQHLTSFDLLDIEPEDSSSRLFLDAADYLINAPLMDVRMKSKNCIVLLVPIPDELPLRVKGDLEGEISSLPSEIKDRLEKMGATFGIRTTYEVRNFSRYTAEQYVMVSIHFSALSAIDTLSEHYLVRDLSGVEQESNSTTYPTLNAIADHEESLLIRAIPRTTPSGAKYSLVASHTKAIWELTPFPNLLAGIDSIVDSDDTLSTVLIIDNRDYEPPQGSDEPFTDDDDQETSDIDSESEHTPYESPPHEYAEDPREDTDDSELLASALTLSFRNPSKARAANHRANLTETMVALQKLQADLFLPRSPGEWEITTLYPHLGRGPQILIPGTLLTSPHHLDLVNELAQSIPVYALTVFDVDEKDRLCMGQLLDFLSEERLTQIRAKKGELVLLLGRYFTTSSEQCFPSTARCDIITNTGERLYGFEIAPKRAIDGELYKSALEYTSRLASNVTELLNAHYDVNGKFDDVEFLSAIRTEYGRSLPTTMLRDLVKLGQYNDQMTFGHVSKAAVTNTILDYCTMHGKVVVDENGQEHFRFTAL